MAMAAVGPTENILAGAAPVPPPADHFGVFLPRRYYALAKIGIWLFHAVCGAYFVAAGLLYGALSTTKLAGMMQLYALTIPRRSMAGVSIAHYVVAALFGRYLVMALWRLIRRRICKSKRQIRPQSTLNILPAPVTAAMSRTRVWRLGAYLYDLVLSPSGVLGVESHYFELFFLLRELTESVLQTYQAYMMSYLLPRAGLNRCYVIVLVLNSWSTPLFYRFARRNKALPRFLSLLCDIILDFVSAVGVPVWLALDYLPNYNVDAKDFPLSFWYNDAWIVRFMNDVPLMFLGNWVGAFSRLLFSISLLTTLDDISSLIKLQTDSVHPKVPPPPSIVSHATPKRHGRLVYAAHMLMVVFGVAILSVQLYAESRPTPRACVLVVRPWLVAAPACALVEINCHATPTLSGNGTDFDAITGPLDRLSLEHIVVRHCPNVEFTPRFQAFANLIGMKLYNVTVETWDDDAAITQVHHPRMRFVFLVRSTFPNATLPRGLISHDYPTALKDVEISGSNIQWLPDDLDKRWPTGLTLFMEYGELPSFPLVLHRLDPRMLSLCGNRITSLPPEAFLLQAYTIAFTGNPLTELPAAGVDPVAVETMFVYIDSTNVSALPLWMDETFFLRTNMYMGGSPFCVDVLHNENSTERAALLGVRPFIAKYVDCSVAPPELQPFYPQYLEVREDELVADSTL